MPTFFFCGDSSEALGRLFAGAVAILGGRLCSSYVVLPLTRHFMLNPAVEVDLHRLQGGRWDTSGRVCGGGRAEKGDLREAIRGAGAEWKEDGRLMAERAVADSLPDLSGPDTQKIFVALLDVPVPPNPFGASPSAARSAGFFKAGSTLGCIGRHFWTI